MTLDQRLAQAAHRMADEVSAPTLDLDSIRSRVRSQRRRAVGGVLVAFLFAAITVGALLTGTGANLGSPLVPASTDSPTTSPPIKGSPLSPIDITPWTTYTSERYNLTIGHPVDWEVSPAQRDWGEGDVADWVSPGHEIFISPDRRTQVSVWSAPLEPGERIETLADIEAWVEKYCLASQDVYCDEIEERGVEMCIERDDCHPALLMPFVNDVQAFFSGGIYSPDAVTVVAVWRGESRPEVVRYGGAQRLLEGFLSTMKVYPKDSLMISTPTSSAIEPSRG